MSRLAVRRTLAGWLAVMLALVGLAVEPPTPASAQDTTFVVTANRMTGEVANDDPSTVPPCTPDDCTLRAAVRAANDVGSATIMFDPDVTGVSVVAIRPNDLNVRGDLAVEGGDGESSVVGLTVDVEPEDAVASSQVFHLDRAVELRLHNLLIGGSHATAGGAVRVTASGATLHLDTTLFQGSSATTGNGGAILMAPGTALEAVDTVFGLNTAAMAGGAVYADGATVTFHNVTLSGNVSDRQGGGLAAVDTTVRVSGSRFERNEALSGGAVSLFGGSDLEVSATSFTDNTATEGDGRGGAIDVSIGSALRADAATFSGNRAKAGGAVHSDHEGTQVELDRSTLRENVASNSGGAILSRGSLTVRDSRVVENRVEPDLKTGEDFGGGVGADGPTHIVGTTIAGNTALHGAGALLFHPETTIERSIVADNDGDGLLVFSGGSSAPDQPVTVRNSTVHGNTGTGLRTGFILPAGMGTEEQEFPGRVSLTHVTVTDNGRVGVVATERSFVDLNSSILAGNVDENCGGAGSVTTRGFNLEDADDCTLADATDLVRTDPELGLLGDNGGPDHGADGGAALSRLPDSSSPAVDSADDRLCGTAPLDVDQRAVARPQGDGCDRGAVEAAAPEPEPDPDPEPVPGGVVRLFGPDRFATAAEVALNRFDPAAVDTVYLATGRDFPDALAGGPLAANDGAPILLATADGVPDVTAEALATLAPSRVVALGGTAVLPDGILTDAAAAAGGADTDRLSGRDRFATAAAIAAAMPGPADTVYLATGRDFPDALAGGPLAAADDAPILLATADGLPKTTVDGLAALAPAMVVALGGTAVLPDAILREAAAAAGGAVTDRLAGSDRFATAAAIAGAMPGAVETVYVATGRDFPDALTGVPAAAGEAAPILLATADALPDPTVTHLDSLANLRRIVILGGTAVISESVGAALAGHLP